MSKKAEPFEVAKASMIFLLLTELPNVAIANSAKPLAIPDATMLPELLTAALPPSTKPEAKVPAPLATAATVPPLLTPALPRMLNPALVKTVFANASIVAPAELVRAPPSAVALTKPLLVARRSVPDFRTKLPSFLIARLPPDAMNLSFAAGVTLLRNAVPPSYALTVSFVPNVTSSINSWPTAPIFVFGATVPSTKMPSAPGSNTPADALLPTVASVPPKISLVLKSTTAFPEATMRPVPPVLQ